MSLGYDQWPVWRLRLAFWASVVWPWSTAWRDIGPVYERKSAERRRQKS
jgi:hypothetical protein